MVLSPEHPLLEKIKTSSGSSSNAPAADLALLKVDDRCWWQHRFNLMVSSSGLGGSSEMGSPVAPMSGSNVNGDDNLHLGREGGNEPDPVGSAGTPRNREVRGSRAIGLAGNGSVFGSEALHQSIAIDGQARTGTVLRIRCHIFNECRNRCVFFQRRIVACQNVCPGPLC